VSILVATVAPTASVHRTPDPATRLASRMLSVYFLMAVLVTLFGHFPVPLFGFGASSVLGAFLGLAALRRARAQGSPVRVAAASASYDAPGHAPLVEDSALPETKCPTRY
jgi:hypothetical protein